MVGGMVKVQACSPGRRGGAVRGLHRETLDHKEVAVDRWVGGLQCQARTQVQALSGAPCDVGSQGHQESKDCPVKDT